MVTRSYHQAAPADRQQWAEATTARGPGSRATRAALDCRVRAIEEDASDKTTEEGR